MPTPAGSPSGLVTLADARAQLNIPAGDTSNDAELQGFVDAAQTVAEDIAGVIVPRVIVGEVCDGGAYKIALRHCPVLSIQSIVEYIGVSAYTLSNQPQSATVDNYGYDLVDPLGGIVLRRGAAGQPLPFLGGRQGVLVSYTAGYATVPPAVRMGALVCIQHWWDNTQQGFAIGGGPFSPDDGTSTIAGYAIPNYAAQLFASLSSSTRKVPGIA